MNGLWMCSIVGFSLYDVHHVVRASIYELQYSMREHDKPQGIDIILNMLYKSDGISRYASILAEFYFSPQISYYSLHKYNII